MKRDRELCDSSRIFPPSPLRLHRRRGHHPRAREHRLVQPSERQLEARLWLFSLSAHPTATRTSTVCVREKKEVVVLCCVRHREEMLLCVDGPPPLVTSAMDDDVGRRSRAVEGRRVVVRQGAVPLTGRGIVAGSSQVRRRGRRRKRG